MTQQVPLVDLAWQHAQVSAEVEAGIAEVTSTGAFILGAAVERFERAFAAFSGVGHCIGVANGTDALELAVRALDIGHGDEVILPANTFVATALAVARAGATPVLADCDPVHHLVDPAAVEACVTPRTRAIMPVHLYGQLAPVEDLASIASRAGLALIDDAAQCQGATRNGAGPATHGPIAGTSFYPGKNLGAYGDAGAVLTNDDALARRVRALRNYGSEVKYEHPETGFNSRLDTIQAVVLTAKLARLGEWNALRRDAAARYDELLAGLDVVRPSAMEGNEHVWHLYVIRTHDRDRVLKELHAAGIGAGIHYPTPVHLHGAFEHLGYRPGSFPVAEQAAHEILSLPLYPGITAAQQERVVDCLRAAL